MKLAAQRLLHQTPPADRSLLHSPVVCMEDTNLSANSLQLLAELQQETELIDFESKSWAF